MQAFSLTVLLHLLQHQSENLRCLRTQCHAFRIKAVVSFTCNESQCRCLLDCFLGPIADLIVIGIGRSVSGLELLTAHMLQGTHNHDNHFFPAYRLAWFKLVCTCAINNARLISCLYSFCIPASSLNIAESIDACGCCKTKCSCQQRYEFGSCRRFCSAKCSVVNAVRDTLEAEQLYIRVSPMPSVTSV